jgi:hypothetical protein
LRREICLIFAEAGQIDTECKECDAEPESVGDSGGELPAPLALDK